MLPDLQSIADRINTGTDSPDASRALVVFNSTPQTLSGIAVLHADMSWPRGVSLPPVSVTETDGRLVPSVLREIQEEPDAKGRTDRVQLSFALYFAVTNVPANGWRTYIASYADVPSPTLEEAAETEGLSVVETLRHDGDLPGTYPDASVDPPETGR